MWFYTRSMKAALLAALLISTFACGRGNSKATYLYVAESNVAQFRVQGDGTLTPLTPATVSVPPYGTNGVGFVAVDPSRQHLFATSGSTGPTPILNQYDIGSDGLLTPSANPMTGFGGTPPVFTPDGRFALTLDYLTGTLSTYSLSSSGTMTLTGEMTPSCPYPVSAIFDLSGRFAYISCDDSDTTIVGYTMSATGTLTPLTPSPLAQAAGYGYMTLSPAGFLYVLNQSGTVSGFSIDGSTGQLTNAGIFAIGWTSPYAISFNTIAFDPTGSYAYVINPSSQSVTQLKVDAATGALSTNGPDASAGVEPLYVAVDPSGKFVFATNSNGGTISQFVIDSTGRLTPNGAYSLGPSSYPGLMTFGQP